MFLRRCTAALTACALAFSGTAFAAPASTTAPAPLISTEQLASALSPVTPVGPRTELLAALDRADLTAALQARGVAVEQVRLRVNALTDEEAQQLLQQIDAAPAGADVLGVLFTVFIILLVTDILGLTKVFPFTRSVR